MTTQTNPCVARGPDLERRRRWWVPGLADVLFIMVVLAVVKEAHVAMMDDPGLGWHLRNADQMWEDGDFLYHETFCGPSLGRPLVCRDWLGDILFRIVYGWGGLAGIAVLTALVIALVLRLLYTWMLADGVAWPMAVFWTFLAALGTQPSWVARPNVFSFLGLALTIRICQQYHRGKISARQTLWLLPIFLLWTNLHGGFVAGLVTLATVYLVECAIGLGATTRTTRAAARQRVRWLTLLGIGVGLVTLLNPYGIWLHWWNLWMVTDSYIQLKTTIEWLSPNFREPGCLVLELLVLSFPLLAATSRRKVDLVSLVLAILWLHFGLSSRRYITLWVVVVVPILAAYSCRLPWLQRAAARILEPATSELRAMLQGRPRRSPMAVSILFAGLILFASPWMGRLVWHNPQRMPAAALDRLLAIYHGETVFHSINWGGYLTWHGWDLTPRFRTWIDDRLDVHGKEHTLEYFDLMAARPGWQTRLDTHHIDLLCLPTRSNLAQQVAETPGWDELFRRDNVVIFRRSKPLRRLAEIDQHHDSSSPQPTGHRNCQTQSDSSSQDPAPETQVSR